MSDNKQGYKEKFYCDFEAIYTKNYYLIQINAESFLYLNRNLG